MEYGERLREAERLEKENQALLTTPLMSEGNISPMQVGLFSPRQKARWQRDAMAKMSLMHTIKQLRQTDEEIAIDEAHIQANHEKERQATLDILQGKIDFIHSLGVMSHKKNGKLKPSYQRTIDIYEEEKQRLIMC